MNNNLWSSENVYNEYWVHYNVYGVKLDVLTVLKFQWYRLFAPINLLWCLIVEVKWGPQKTVHTSKKSSPTYPKQTSPKKTCKSNGKGLQQDTVLLWILFRISPQFAYWQADL